MRPRVPVAAAVLTALVDALDHDAEIRYRRALCGEAYARGLADGWRRGYTQRDHETEQAHRVLAERVRRTTAAPAWDALAARRAGYDRPPRTPDQIRARARSSWVAEGRAQPPGGGAA